MSNAHEQNVIGDELRRLRKAAGMTLHACADHVGIPWQTLANYELGKVVPPSDKLFRITHALRRVQPGFRFARIARTVAA